MEKLPYKEEDLHRDLAVYFREIDHENIGVVTRSEFIKIVSNLGLKLNEKEEA